MVESKFCPLPWFNITTDVNGSVRPCCRYAQPGISSRHPQDNQPDHPMPWLKDGTIKSLWNGPELKKLRKAFIDGVQPVECNWCWKEEQAGITSYRQKRIKWQPEHFDDIDFTTDSADAPRVFDIKLSNVCNLKCRMCNHLASSSILKEEKLHRSFLSEDLQEQKYWLSNKILGTDNEADFISWLPNIVQIELTGGEPLVSPENKELIKRISETPYAKNISVQLTTNATHYSDTIVKQLKQFKTVYVDASIDDIGKRIEYARHGSNWDVIAKNINKYNQIDQFVFHIWATVNNYNIWYLDELINYCDQNNIKIALGALHTPRELSIQHLPEYLKDAIREKYKALPNMAERLQPIINFLDASTDSYIEDFLATTKRHDETRKESFKDVFPEWREMIYYG